MAGSINQTQVQWSAADSISLSTNSVVDSDAVSVNAEDDSGSVQISCDNSGTPASGDVIDIYVKWSNGDVLGDSSDDFDTSEHAEWLCRLDTYATNTPGEDPARKTVPLRVRGKKAFKIAAVAAQGASRAVTLRVRYVGTRGQ
ncbi:MAG: hypothetical protein GYA66_01565 [Phyllobacteriaceae bacterium]|nr:hypothetical protein [Phyllobacteriaceae bacterium]